MVDRSRQRHDAPISAAKNRIAGSVCAAPMNSRRPPLDEADALVIAAGAGIGVDSGLPDFRGEDGFWKAYPALGRARTRFSEIASPYAFQTAPLRAWAL